MSDDFAVVRADMETILMDSLELDRPHLDWYPDGYAVSDAFKRVFAALDRIEARLASCANDGGTIARLQYELDEVRADAEQLADALRSIVALAAHHLAEYERAQDDDPPADPDADYLHGIGMKC